MKRLHPNSTRTGTLLPYTTLFRSNEEPRRLRMPYQPVQIVGREPVLAAGAVKLTPALNRNADANHDQRVAEQHRDQHARRAQAEQGGPEICAEIDAVQLEKPRAQVNRERKADRKSTRLNSRH